MPGNSLDPIKERRLDMLLKQTSLTGFFSVLFATILTVLLRNTEHLEPMIYWVGINLLMVLTREIFIYPYFRARRQRGESHFQLIHGVIVFFWLFAGLIWGIGGYLFLPQENHPELVITFVTTYIGLTAGNIISFAPSIWTGVAFTVPAILGLAFKVHEYGYIVFFYCMLIYIVFLLIAISRISKVVIKTISVDLDNERLLKEVMVEKERAELEKDRAEKANLSKSEFLAAASHDLRQPLNSIGLFLYGLKQKLQGDSNGKLQLAEKIEKAYQSLSEMFSLLLEISSFDTGKIKVRANLIQPTRAVQSIREELTEAATAKGLKIHHTASKAWALTDEVLLSRIVRNLLGNAIKYTAKGHIEITERLHLQQLSIEISDTGIGIPEQELENIFNEYHQVGNKRRDRKEGVGLGLFISKRLCDLLGYDIRVESTEGKGSSFTITLPATEPQNAPVAQAQDTQLPSLENIHLLVIDDDPEILTGMKLILEQWLCVVDTASDYHQASAAVAARLPDIILCDYRLQDNMTGIEVLHSLEQQQGKPIPAIIITGEHLTTIEAELHQTDYQLLSKPIQPMQLHASISNLLDPIPKSCRSG
jgi:signal transduction histidine kinase/CheY-like chemotaxis protein